MIVVEAQSVIHGEVMSYLPRILGKNPQILIPDIYLTVAIRLQQTPRYTGNVGLRGGQVSGGRSAQRVSLRKIVGFQSSLERGWHYIDERNGSIKKVILATEP